MSDSEPKHPDEEHARVDYASTLVKPEAYVVICPSCKYQHKAKSLNPYRCPQCNKAISVNL